MRKTKHKRIVSETKSWSIAKINKNGMALSRIIKKRKCKLLNEIVKNGRRAVITDLMDSRRATNKYYCQHRRNALILCNHNLARSIGRERVNP